MSVLRYAVFGSPIAHSLSPQIHQAFAAECGIALEYRAIEATVSAFPDALRRFHAEGGAGANVTLPLKEVAVTQVTALDPAARRAGAVNTLVREGAGWRGANTDGIGLIADLQRLEVVLGGARVVVLGAGGAVRGIVGPLLDAGVAAIVVANRSAERVAALVGAFGDPRLRAADPASMGDMPAPDLLINAISAGHERASPVLPAGICRQHTVAYDLSYGIAASGFLAWARAQGSRLSVDGLGMLVGQAAEAFALWHRCRPNVDQVLTMLRARIPTA